MKALILSGGRGTRLRPLTFSLAKQLIPVAGRPILHFVLDQVKKVGIEKVGVIICSETGDQIKNSLAKNRWGFDFSFILQKEPKGLAHAVKVARNFLKNDPFLMYLGDNLIGGNIKNLAGEFQKFQLDALVLLKKVKNPQQFGVAELDRKGNLKNLIEKPKIPPSDLALTGIYFFSPLIHLAIDKIKPSSRGELEITDAIMELMKNQNVRGKILKNWWLDTGKKDDLLEANKLILNEEIKKEIKGRVSPGSKVEGLVCIKEKTRIIDSVIQGPCFIDGSSIIKNSRIGPYVSLGKGCYIENSDLTHSVILEQARIVNVSQLKECVVGRNTVVKKENGKLFKLLIGDNSEVIF